MLKSFVVFSIGCLLIVPLDVFSAVRVAAATPVSIVRHSASTLADTAPRDLPTRIVVPSVGIDSPIQGVGVNSLGEMDVPNGATTNVGWYAPGTVPGQTGSAVLDAHVFAAFSDLKYLKVGSEIFVKMASGKLLSFIVTDSRVYTLASVPLQRLFADTSGQLLNLITCAGSLVPDGSTYDHRLVVYTRLLS